MCNECRKKQKLKKRMGEMKRRMKLVGSSKAGTSKSKIARSVSAHADSDVGCGKATLTWMDDILFDLFFIR